ncbi:uncharacterized protein LOC143622882 [Bidens hawaiensis]|uniref:uncharacterized protein LOC143622882 n=1 Tax=Bidens hawaiensis TaxID=980011 RepID=UPI00404B0D8E
MIGSTILEQKKEILTFCVARTSEVSQIEKDLEAEISAIEKQRDKLEAELREVKSTLVDAITRLQDAREQRLQFDEDNNDFFLNLKEKEDELSKAIVSFRAEADACNAFINFLESTWDFQSSFVNQRDKQVNDQLQNHEAYIVNVVSSFLTTYKDQLEPAIANLRKLLQSLKGYQYVIDPDEEFLQDTKQRVNIEQEYLDAEAKVVNIFNTVESIKEHFYSAVDDASRKDIEEINKLFSTIEKLERDFKINKRPTLRIEIPTDEDLSLLSPSTGSPQGVKISSPVRVMPDFKSIFSQNLIKSPRRKPYIPLGVSCENSPASTMENDIKPTENKQQKVKVQEPEKPSQVDINVSNPTLKVENTTSRSEQLQVPESQESKMCEHATLDLDKELMTSALKKETGLNTETTQSGPGETPEAATDSNAKIPELPLGAEHLSGNEKKSVDPDEKLSNSNSEIKEKDQVSTEDIASREPDEVVQEQKDDSYPHKNDETSPGEGDGFDSK